MAQSRTLRLAHHHGPGDAVLPNGQMPAGHRLIVRVLPAGRAARRARVIVRDVLHGIDTAEDRIRDAELVVAELAANAERHACRPYELRITVVGGCPVWCQVIDGDPDLAGIPEIFARLGQHATPHVGEPELRESGHGLAIVHRLTRGWCLAFPTVTCAGGRPGKAVAFALRLSDRSRS